MGIYAEKEREKVGRGNHCPGPSAPMEASGLCICTGAWDPESTRTSIPRPAGEALWEVGEVECWARGHLHQPGAGRSAAGPVHCRKGFWTCDIPGELGCEEPASLKPCPTRSEQTATPLHCSMTLPPALVQGAPNQSAEVQSPCGGRRLGGKGCSGFHYSLLLADCVTLGCYCFLLSLLCLSV